MYANDSQIFYCKTRANSRPWTRNNESLVCNTDRGDKNHILALYKVEY